MKKIRDDFIYGMSAHSSREGVSISVTLTNESPYNRWLRSDAMYLDGIREKDFHISGPSFIICRTAGAPQPNKLVKLRSSETITHTVLLSDMCFFNWAKAGEYLFKKQSVAYLFVSQEAGMYHQMHDDSCEMVILKGNVSFHLYDRLTDELPLSGESDLAPLL